MGVLAGLGAPFLATALFMSHFLAQMKRLRRWSQPIPLAGGIVMILMGLAMVTGLLSAFSYWLLDTFPVLGRIASDGDGLQARPALSVGTSPGGAVRILRMVVVENAAMFYLRRCVLALVVCVLGFQAAAVAAHTHFLPAPVAHAAYAEHHAHVQAQADEGEAAASHHGASCITAQSCFPAAHAASALQLPLTATSPPPAFPSIGSLPALRHDPLLRPPRQLG